MSHVLPLLSHLNQKLGHALKEALMIFQNCPNFVGRLARPLNETSLGILGRFGNFSENVTFLLHCHVTGVTFVTEA